MKYKKSQINQVFVYLLSIILILFAGFLVTKFIISFSGTVDSSQNVKIYSKFENDYTKVFTSYGSEEIFNYKVSKDVKLICFANKIRNCDSIKNNISNSAFENFNITIQSKNNIGIFDVNDLISSKSIGSLNMENNCLCIEPKSGLFSIVLENKKNKVFISENK